MQLSDLNAILAEWWAFLKNPRQWRIEHKAERKAERLRAIRFEHDLLAAQYREARLGKRRQLQSKLLKRLGELLREELELTRSSRPERA